MAHPEETELLSSNGDKSLVNGTVKEETTVPIEHGPQSPNLTGQLHGPSTSSGSHSRLQSSLCGPRNLAIMSIVCGLSCVGVKALILALQAEHETDQEKSVSLSRRSRRMSALSILLWLGVLLCVPFLLVLLSYVLAVAE